MAMNEPVAPIDRKKLEERPEISVKVAGHSAVVTTDGVQHRFSAVTTETLREQVMDRVLEAAVAVDRPVVASLDEDGSRSQLIVDPDGRVEVDQVAGSLGSSTPPDPDPSPAPRPSPTPPSPKVETNIPPEYSAPAVPQQAPPPTPTPAPTPATAPVDQPPPREPQPADESFLTIHQSKPLAERGFRGLLNKYLGFKLGPTAAEAQELSAIDAICQPWDGPRTIVVINPKGGANKTPTVILLSALFGAYGGGSVLAWDNNDTRGTLGWRTEKAPSHAAHVRDLLPHTERLMQAAANSGDLNAFVHRQKEDKFDVLRSTPEKLPNQGRLTDTDFDAVHAVAEKYYRLIFVDSGNDETAPHWLRAIDRADQIVVATTTRSDRAEAARLMLKSLKERDAHSAELASKAVVIVSQAAKDEAPANEVSAEFYRLGVRAAMPIPYDSAIGADWLRLKPLKRKTRRAYLEAAKAVAQGL